MAFEGLTEKLSAAFKKLRGKGRLTENDVREAMREVRLALLEADVNFKVVKQFVASVTERAVGSDVLESLTPAQMIVKIVNEELTNLMGGNEPKYLRLKNKGQTVLMMCGLQGNGKTTHAAKLGKYYRSQGRRRPGTGGADHKILAPPRVLGPPDQKDAPRRHGQQNGKQHQHSAFSLLSFLMRSLQK